MYIYKFILNVYKSHLTPFGIMWCARIAAMFES